jgi:phosphate-selective porin OprO and OprP
MAAGLRFSYKIPIIGRLQAGHFKEPIGLEVLTSSRFLTFMERATPMEAFIPERNIGVMVSRPLLGERMTYAVGAFTDTDSLGRVSEIDGNWRASARATGVPWYDEGAKGSRLVHLGVSGSYVDPIDDAARFRSRPEAHLAPRFVDTGAITGVDHSSLVGAEAALVFGPFSAQAEYVHTWVSAPGETMGFDGFYAFASWFITGENRVYKRSTGTFDRVVPRKNATFADGGIGAWEIALRYSHLDLNNDGVNGGRLNDITAGVNWYLNPNAKLQVNYVHAMVDRGEVDADAQIVQGRIAIDF